MFCTAQGQHTTASMEIMQWVVSNHLDLLFGQHISVIVACVAFATAKAMSSTMPFKRLLQELAVMAKSECTRQLVPLATVSDMKDMSATFRAVPLPASPGSESPKGDIRQFYNTCFLPRAEGGTVHRLNNLTLFSTPGAAFQAEAFS